MNSHVGGFLGKKDWEAGKERFNEMPTSSLERQKRKDRKGGQSLKSTHRDCTST